MNRREWLKLMASSSGVALLPDVTGILAARTARRNRLRRATYGFGEP